MLLRYVDVISVEVGRRLLRFRRLLYLVSVTAWAGSSFRCPFALTCCRQCNLPLFFRWLFLALWFLPDDGSHRCHQFVVPLRHLGFVFRGGTI